MSNSPSSWPTRRGGRLDTTAAQPSPPSGTGPAPRHPPDGDAAIRGDEPGAAQFHLAPSTGQGGGHDTLVMMPSESDTSGTSDRLKTVLHVVKSTSEYGNGEYDQLAIALAEDPQLVERLYATRKDNEAFTSLIQRSRSERGLSVTSENSQRLRDGLQGRSRKANTAEVQGREENEENSRDIQSMERCIISGAVAFCHVTIILAHYVMDIVDYLQANGNTIGQDAQWNYERIFINAICHVWRPQPCHELRSRLYVWFCCVGVPIARLIIAALPRQPQLAQGTRKIMWRYLGGVLFIRMAQGPDTQVPRRFFFRQVFGLNNAQRAAMRGCQNTAEVAERHYLYTNRCALFGLRVSQANGGQVPQQYDLTNKELNHIIAPLLAAHPLPPPPDDNPLEHGIETAVLHELRCILGRLRITDTARDVRHNMGY
ncbi:unnamed protein product [Vitrella brassicaformis CCMP3155]|uniref:Uncharacterized protein n=1 Tax=Vitrella brassicaformis (strain CCMP3155) TaxID=1169540 RepID=A0A0G4EX38_VITBC|nr:unnamed protein product [Vitrella brassicaformis CCMP3155]|eukprot:CEM02654.1 unnamed protein product [Vitrella brassicaformis CCMP3155]